MSTYRKLTTSDDLPVSLTRQGFAPFRSDTGKRNDKGEIVYRGHLSQVFVNADGDECEESDVATPLYEANPKFDKGSVYGHYGVCVKADGSESMVIPLLNKKSNDRMQELTGDPDWIVSVTPDSRLVEDKITGAAKPKLTKQQQGMLSAAIAGTATPEQLAELAKLV